MKDQNDFIFTEIRFLVFVSILVMLGIALTYFTSSFVPLLLSVLFAIYLVVKNMINIWKLMKGSND